MRKLFQIFLFISCIGYSFGQNNRIQIKRSFLKSYYSYTVLTQYTFNLNGDILENSTVYINDNKPDTVSQIKYKYKKTELLEREVYHNKRLILNEKYSYKKGHLNSIQYLDDSKLTNYYDSNNNLRLDVMTKALDTLRTITYTYKGNELVELFRYSNNVDNERITYKKSNDTLIETIYKHDSLHLEKPQILINKKKFNPDNFLIYSSNNLYDNYIIEKSYSYNSKNQLIKIDTINTEDNSTSKERSFFFYENVFLNKIENQELVEGNWETIDSIQFKKETTTKKHNYTKN